MKIIIGGAGAVGTHLAELLSNEKQDIILMDEDKDKQTVEYHIPALLNETILGLNLQPGGIYVDVTLGGGGHSSAILHALEPFDNKGKLYSFDQDPDESIYQFLSLSRHNIAKVCCKKQGQQNNCLHQM